MTIEFEKYTKAFGKNTVLDKIDLTLEGGKIYGLSGKNGSGKTMLMRAMCGLILPSEGKVKANGKEIGKEISFPEKTGILIENPGFIGSYSGFRNLKYLAEISGRVDDDGIRDILRRVGLDPEDKKPYRKYSLGMKQKLGIGAALMEKNELILLDEPFNALDEDGIERVRALIAQQKKKDTVIVISCHDKEELEGLSDVIISMKNGKITEVSKK